MTHLTWTLGAGGLLGSRVRDSISRELAGAVESKCQGRTFSWSDAPRVADELARAAVDFVAEARRPEVELWTVAWCAGAGVIGTDAATLAAETATLRNFLAALGNELDKLPAPVPGIVFLTSSAGGVYAGNPERPLTENSAVAPISPYGEAKLAQEELLARWADSRAGVSVMIARVANAYGPGQNLRKQQGVVSLLARAMIRHQPVQIYVPMDTRRDYVYAADCGRMAARCLARAATAARAGNTVRLIKIMASEQTTSIAELIGTFRRLFRDRPHIVHAQARTRRSLQPSDLSFRTVVWPELHLRGSTPLAVGVHRLFHDLLARYQSGGLPQRTGAR